MSGDLNHWRAGDRMGDFIVQRRLGSGFEAVVYLVRDVRDGKLRTVKLFRRTMTLAEVEHTFRHWQQYAGLGCVRQCLEMGMLRGQRRVSERPWLLLEYVPGVMLAEKIERSQIRDPTSLALRLLQTLAPLHERNLGWGDADYGRNLIVERGSGRFVLIDMDAGTPGHPPPAIYEDLLEVLWLARRCAGEQLPSQLVKVLKDAPDAIAALQALSGTHAAQEGMSLPIPWPTA